MNRPQTFAGNPLCENHGAVSIFPGISLFFFNIHTGKASFSKCGTSECLEIYHCREGRMECSMNGRYCYLSPGDLLLARSDTISSDLYFPLRHYHGITVRIEIPDAPKCLSCFLRDVNVQPVRIKEKFCGEQGYSIVRSSPSFEHIFSELYHVPEEVRSGYCKIKVLELMLFLSVFDLKESASSSLPLSPGQASLAKEVARYLSQNMEERLTLEQAAKKFHASPSNIKNSFKAVYGVPFYAFTRAQKMESAAYMLEYTEKSILEIANAHGYDNGGKFAGAFRSVKGVTPGAYRLQSRKLHLCQEEIVWKTRG